MTDASSLATSPVASRKTPVPDEQHEVSSTQHHDPSSHWFTRGNVPVVSSDACQITSHMLRVQRQCKPCSRGDSTYHRDTLEHSSSPTHWSQG